MFPQNYSLTFFVTDKGKNKTLNKFLQINMTDDIPINAEKKKKKISFII